jgi:hypothetical protein
VQLARGAARLTAGEQRFDVRAGDGVAVLSEGPVELAGAGAEPAEFLVFDLG